MRIVHGVGGLGTSPCGSCARADGCAEDNHVGAKASYLKISCTRSWISVVLLVIIAFAVDSYDFQVFQAKEAGC